jgi:GNAT superfamily N-acetyltransferase
MGSDMRKLTREFRATLYRNRLPLNIVAVSDGRIIGTAALKDNEMLDVFPENRFWMGSVFVDPTWRGRGIATALANRIVEMARERHLPHLYLQTADISGGLYARLGWEPVERLMYRGTDTLLMIKHLDD